MKDQKGEQNLHVSLQPKRNRKMKRHGHSLNVLISHAVIIAAACAGGANAREPAPPVPPPPKLPPVEILGPPQVAPPTSVLAPPASAESQNPPDVSDHVGHSGTESAFRIGDPITVHALKSSWSRSHAVPSPQASNTDLLAAISTEVIALSADGRVQIQGLHTATVNGRDEIYRVTGYVRPEDIDAGGMVDSRRLTTPSVELLGNGVADSSVREHRIDIMFKLLGLQRAR